MTRLARTLTVTVCAALVAVNLAVSALAPDPPEPTRFICQPGSQLCHAMASDAGAVPAEGVGR